MVTLTNLSGRNLEDEGGHSKGRATLYHIE